MDIEQQFNDLGVDAITGIQLMQSLGLNSDDFYDGARFMRFKDVIDFFKDIPDRDYILNKITIGKNVDRLDHTWTYTQLAKQKRELKSHIEDRMNKLTTIEKLGDEMSHDTVKLLQSQIMDNKVQLSRLDEQLDQYA